MNSLIIFNNFSLINVLFKRNLKEKYEIIINLIYYEILAVTKKVPLDDLKKYLNKSI